MARARRKKPGFPWVKVALAVIVVAALAAAWRYTPLSEYITAERINAWGRWVRELPLAPAIVAFAYTPASLVLFPRPLLTLLAVIAFGPWVGFATAMGGILTAALVTYCAGRALPQRTLERLVGDKAKAVRTKLREHGLMAVFLMRLVPVAPFAVESMAAGAARVKVWHYVLGTFLAMAPAVLAETVFGVQLTAALDEAAEMNYWIAGAAVAAFLVLTVGIAWWKNRG